MRNMLQIVGCTHKKIWDEVPDALFYTEARHVYKGRGFLKALIVAKQPWVILSAKYGFVEPEHPICRYDIVLGSPGSVSDATLKAQVYQTRFWWDEGRLVEVRLQDFPHILPLNCNKTYVEKIRMAFSRNQIHLKE